MSGAICRQALRALAVLLAAGLWSCVPVDDKAPEPTKVERVWPAPPAEARISYVQSFSSAEDLGISRSLVSFLADFLLGDEDSRLLRPTNVLAVNAQLIYVTDAGLGAVHRFDIARGKHEVIRIGEEPMPSPVAMAQGAAGEIYVSDSALGEVFVIRPGAETAVPLGLVGDLSQPTGLAVDPVSGDLLVVDTAEHAVKRFGPDGLLLERFGQRGSEDGEFNYPTMIWRQANGNLLVTDSLNFRIQVFDGAGNFLRTFGRPGNATGDIARPKGVATDGHGHVYVVDSLFHVFQIFDEQGKYLMNVGAQGSRLGEFWLPTGIFIGQEGRVYVADSFNKRVQVFRYLGAKP